MVTDLVLDRIIWGLGIATGVLALYCMNFSRNLSNFQNSIISAEEIAVKGKVNSKVIVEGLAKQSKTLDVLGSQVPQPADIAKISVFSQVTQPFVYGVHQVEYLNRGLQKVVDAEKPTTLISNFSLGNSEILVKISEKTRTFPTLVIHKIDQLTMTWLENFISLFNKSKAYFKRTTVRIVPVDYTVYIEGVLKKDNGGNLVILADQVHLSQDSLFSPSSAKRKFVFFTLCLIGSALVAVLIAKYCKNRPHNFSLAGGPPCVYCKGPSNILLPRCGHLICHKCILTSRSCSCGVNINDYYKLIEAN